MADRRRGVIAARRRDLESAGPYFGGSTKTMVLRADQRSVNLLRSVVDVDLGAVGFVVVVIGDDVCADVHARGPASVPGPSTIFVPRSGGGLLPLEVG
jgi:hypothetical protein